jgi:hypothetical protein
VRHDQRHAEHRNRKDDGEHRDSVLDVRVHGPILLRPARGLGLDGPDYGRSGLPADYLAETDAE